MKGGIWEDSFCLQIPLYSNGDDLKKKKSLFIHEREREREAEGEAGSLLSREHDAGLNLRILRS